MFSFRPDNVNQETDDMAFEEVEFGMEREEEPWTEQKEEDADEDRTGTGVAKCQTDEECKKLTEETTCLVFLKQIMILAEKQTRKFCEDCGSSIHVDHTFIGSALYLKWVSTCFISKRHVRIPHYLNLSFFYISNRFSFTKDYVHTWTFLLNNDGQIYMKIREYKSSWKLG